MSAAATREAIVRAVIDVIADSGFDGLSVRAVAGRAELSTGAVQHHFRTKQDMLHAAMAAVTSAAGERYAALETIDDPVDRLHAIVDLLIPRDSADRVARVWLAFAARATVDEETRRLYTTAWGRVRSGLRLLLAVATGRAETAADDSAELLALLDGLAVSVVAEPERMTPATARRIARRRIAGLIAGR